VRTTFLTPVGRGLVFVVIAAIAWGTGGVIAAVLYRTSGLGPVAVSFWRTVIGVALLAALYARRRPGPGPTGPRRRRWLITVVTGVGLAIYQTAYYAAVAQSGVAFATVLTLGSAPILIAVAARLAIAERLGLAGSIAVALAPVGLLLIVGGTLGAAGGGGTVAGTVYSLLSASGYAVVTVLHRALGGVDPARTTLTGFAVATVVLAPLAVLEGLWPTRGNPIELVALLGYLGVVSTALAYSLFFASLGVVRATTVSILSLAEPLTAAAIAVLLLGERLTWAMLAGAGVLLAAVAVLARGETTPEASMAGSG
jgi:DME family drug/metabolite transporter